MRRNRTTHGPVLNLGSRPIGPQWTWDVTYRVRSSGYPEHAHVTAHSWADGDVVSGSASCEVQHDDDLVEVLECLATEAMLAACDYEASSAIPHRRVVFSSTF